MNSKELIRSLFIPLKENEYEGILLLIYSVLSKITIYILKTEKFIFYLS